MKSKQGQQVASTHSYMHILCMSKKTQLPSKLFFWEAKTHYAYTFECTWGECLREGSSVRYVSKHLTLGSLVIFLKKDLVKH